MPVDTWPDSGWAGNDAVQSGVGRQPVFNSAGPNGQPVVSFDGQNDTLELSDLLLARHATIVVVSRPGVELAQGETQLLMTSAESAFSFGYTRDEQDHFLVSLADEDDSATLESSYALDDGYQVFILDIAGDAVERLPQRRRRRTRPRKRFRSDHRARLCARR